MNCYQIVVAVLLLASLFGSPANAVDVSAELGLVTDYRYRGISLSGGKPAVQALILLEDESGAYASIWSSTIEESEFDADIELDLTGGYAVAITDHISLDLSGTYYLYPSKPRSNYAEATALIERSRGPAILSAGISFVPKQRGTADDHGSKRHNSYLFVAASYALPKIPLTLSAQFGSERGAFDESDHGGKWDWCLGTSVRLDRLRMGLAYSGTDVGDDAMVASISLDL